MQQLLNFTVADTRLAIDLEGTRKVIPLVALRPLPKPETCIAGLMNLGGASVPVIDLALRLDFPNNNAYTLAASIVICLREGQMFGIIADRIDGVCSVNDEAIELADVLRSDSMPYTGVYRSEQNCQILILDLDKVLDLACIVDSFPDLEQSHTNTQNDVA